MITRKSVKKKPVASSIEIVAPGVKLNTRFSSVAVRPQMAHLTKGKLMGYFRVDESNGDYQIILTFKSLWHYLKMAHLFFLFWNGPFWDLFKYEVMCPIFVTAVLVSSCFGHSCFGYETWVRNNSRLVIRLELNGTYYCILLAVVW